jgi:hypothetical protein
MKCLIFAELVNEKFDYWCLPMLFGKFNAAFSVD